MIKDSCSQAIPLVVALASTSLSEQMQVSKGCLQKAKTRPEQRKHTFLLMLLYQFTGNGFTTIAFLVEGGLTTAASKPLI